MSSIVNKVKDALHSDKSSNNTEGVSSSDDRVGSQYGSSQGGYMHGTGTTGRSAGSSYPEGANSGSGSGAREGEYGPHSSRVANAADPRVDSDLDNRRTTGTGVGATGGSTGRTGGSTGHTAGSTGHTAGSTGHTAGSSYPEGAYSGGKSGAREGEYGPHSSRVANAADPRVDSDLDNRRTTGTGVGATGGSTGRTTGSTGHTAGSTGHTAGSTGRTAGSSYGEGTYGSGSREGEYGPHSSRVANAADPRVDSDLDNRRTAGTGAGATGGYSGGTGSTGGYSGGTGNTGGYSGGAGSTGAFGGSGGTGYTGTHGAPTGTHGPHNSRAANAADPRVDSDRDGRGAFPGSGPGPASGTAGPHKSNLMNKADPRVDSDLDASKTFGGNKTYQ